MNQRRGFAAGKVEVERNGLGPPHGEEIGVHFDEGAAAGRVQGVAEADFALVDGGGIGAVRPEGIRETITGFRETLSSKQCCHGQ